MDWRDCVAEAILLFAVCPWYSSETSSDRFGKLGGHSHMEPCSSNEAERTVSGMEYFRGIPFDESVVIALPLTYEECAFLLVRARYI
jgi:hypothetical protein